MTNEKTAAEWRNLHPLLRKIFLAIGWIIRYVRCCFVGQLQRACTVGNGKKVPQTIQFFPRYGTFALLAFYPQLRVGWWDTFKVEGETCLSAPVASTRTNNTPPRAPNAGRNWRVTIAR